MDHFSNLCLSLFLLIIVTVVTSSNIESSASGDGSFCIVKPPKRSIYSNCTSSEMCESLLGVSSAPPPPPPSYYSTILQCGDQGECVSNLNPENEHCKEACESSNCSALCLQLYETKNAKYCIETRDHPNALPPNNKVIANLNKYYCTCILQTNDDRFHHHKIVRKHLR